MKRMKIAVIGAGGVGGYFGARLAASGEDVAFIARGAHLAAMRERGIEVRSANGDLRLPVRATGNPAEVGPVDWVWIAVKLWDTAAAAETARPMIGPGTSVVSFQNGVEKEDVLRAALPDAHLVGGVTYIGSTIAEPGVIRHTGTMARLEFGEFDNRRSEQVEALLGACLRARVDARIPSDIRAAIWQKYAYLVGMSGVTAAARVPVGEIRAHARTRRLLREIVEEAAAVGRALGVALSDEMIAARLEQFETLPAEMTSSMHQDLKRGNRLEVEWLNGAVVRLGERLGVPTPCNRAIWALLEPWAAGRPGAPPDRAR
jgi:2-dehydropantoate 2-reductase